MEQNNNQTIQSKGDFYKSIVNGFKTRANKFDDKGKVVNDVVAFVMNEVEQKAIEQHCFENKETFRRFKTSYRYTPNLFGYTFSLKDIKEKDAKVFYNFYKVVRMIDVIKKYENIFRETIVTDYNALIQNLFEMIKKDDLNFGKAKGLSSSFRYVPEVELFKVVERLNYIAL